MHRTTHHALLALALATWPVAALAQDAPEPDEPEADTPDADTPEADTPEAEDPVDTVPLRSARRRISLPGSGVHDLSLTVGGWPTGSGFREVSGGLGATALGLRGSYRLHPVLAVVGGYEHTELGTTLRVPTEAGSFADEVGSSLSGDLLGVGLMGLWPGNRVVQPYATAELLGWHGLLRLDDVTDRQTNPGQLLADGWSMGGRFAAGARLGFNVDRKQRVGFFVHAELGWMGLLEHPYMGLRTAVPGEPSAPVGDGLAHSGLFFQGATARIGAGVRFR